MKGDGVSLLEVSEVQHRALVGILERVRVEHSARVTVLAESCGRPLAVSSPDPAVDLDSLASLSASAIAASCQLAMMLGEPGASLVLQRGDRDVLFLEPAGDLVIAVVLDALHPRGLERVRARLRLKRALSEMQAVLARPETPPGFDAIGDSELDALLHPIAEAME
jgi:predicted regulator of Ras-like GTPase activity (Roadblock/LC7/MglB family)